jgi:hypothetical protein
VTVLKFALLVGVPIWLAVVVIRCMRGWFRKRRDDGDDSESSAPPPPPEPSPVPAGAPVTPSDAASASEPFSSSGSDTPDNPPGWEPA